MRSLKPASFKINYFNALKNIKYWVLLLNYYLLFIKNTPHNKQ